MQTISCSKHISTEFDGSWQNDKFVQVHLQRILSQITLGLTETPFPHIRLTLMTTRVRLGAVHFVPCRCLCLAALHKLFIFYAAEWKHWLSILSGLWFHHSTRSDLGEFLGSNMTEITVTSSSEGLFPSSPSLGSDTTVSVVDWGFNPQSCSIYSLQQARQTQTRRVWSLFLTTCL